MTEDDLKFQAITAYALSAATCKTLLTPTSYWRVGLEMQFFMFYALI